MLRLIIFLALIEIVDEAVRDAVRHYSALIVFIDGASERINHGDGNARPAFDVRIMHSPVELTSITR